ncbi:hypothetical protein Tco_0070698 [Tanacetum coccineum]
METEVESMVTVPIQQVSSSVPLLILQSSISHLLNQYLLPVKNHSLQLSPPTSALQQSRPVLHEMTSDQIRSDLTPNRQETSVDNISSDLQRRQIRHNKFLFSPLLEEYYNLTHGQAKENNNNQAPNASFQEDEFINPFCTRVQEIGESSSRNIDNTDVHSFQPQSHDYRWTRDHPLEQVRGNPTMPVQTRRQLAADPEMCMFALTMSIVEPKNIKEAMADSAWIEAMQDELHQFDRLNVWELVDKPFGKMVISLICYGRTNDEYQLPFREDKCLIRRENQCFIVFLSGALFQPHRRRDILSFMEHLKMEMEIPCSNKIKFITACSFSNDSFEDIMKAQVSVIKASATLNIQAFKIKKSVSISFRMTQVHKMAKDHMMMIKDYDWMMISKKLKDHIQVKLKPKSLKFTASDSQDTDQ